MITTRQGPLLQGEWRQRLVNGAYTIRATGIFQLDKDVFLQNGIATPGYRDLRGSVETSGQFNLIGEMDLGLGRRRCCRDKTYIQDYGLLQSVQSANLLKSTPDYALSQLYLVGTRRPQLLRRAHACTSTASRRPTTRSRSRSSIR